MAHSSRGAHRQRCLDRVARSPYPMRDVFSYAVCNTTGEFWFFDHASVSGERAVMFRRAVEIDFDPIDHHAGIKGVDLQFVAAGIEHLEGDGSDAGVAQHVVAPFIAAADGGVVE